MEVMMEVVEVVELMEAMEVEVMELFRTLRCRLDSVPIDPRLSILKAQCKRCRNF